jgi:N-acetylglucosaminyldiphosphoundecaprenol N-acetyl-beta-D-mannosaminyltransferase
VVLGCPVDLVDERAAVDALVALVDRRRLDDSQPGGLVVTLNPEMVMRARRDAVFRGVVERAALLVPDGIGLVRAVRRRGHQGASRVGGADMLMAYLPEAVGRGHRLALAGARPGVAAVAAHRLRARFPGLTIVAADSGDPDESLAERLRAARPDMVWAAFGAGRQELFLDHHLDAIGAGAGVGVGGTLDYIAGRAVRAPAPLRSAGLEWAWRLALEPWRLRRQLELPRFWVLERAEVLRRARPDSLAC